ncbi:MAG: hypothetical protein AAGK14_06480 [Verrucomicrobiota bacterium]
MRSCLLLLAALLAATSAPAQNTPPPGTRPLQASDLIRVTPRRAPNGEAPANALKLQIDTFFAGLKKGETRGAYNQLLKGSRIASQPDKVELLVAKTDQAFGIYGKMIKYEPYDTYSVGSSLVSTTYLTNLPVQPLRWRFVFYKPEDDWTIIDVRVDDVIVDLLED